MNIPTFRQIKQLSEPIEVIITELNTGGLLTRIEVCCHRCMFVHSMWLDVKCLLISDFLFQGLQAFLPKAEFLNRANSFTELKENVSSNSLEFFYDVTLGCLIGCDFCL